MRKAITVWLIAFIGLMGMSGASLQAQATSGTAGPLTWTYDTGTKTLTISGTGEMPNYYWRQEAPWKGLEGEMTTLVIKEGVTSISQGVFTWCPNLTSVTVPASVKKIGVYVFSGCHNLPGITVAAENTEYTSEDGVLFSKDKTVLVRYSAGHPGTTYAVPDGVKKIEEGAFDGCHLTSVTFPTSLTTIGARVFMNNTALTSVTIPASVETIGEAAFSSSLLEEIKVDDANTVYASVEGVLFNKEKTTLLQYPENRPGSTYTIPPTVTMIGREAFLSVHYLTSMTIPENVTAIDENAFDHCYVLALVSISSGVKTIARNAFSFCPSLTQITVNAGNNYYTSVDGVLFDKGKTILLTYPAGRPGTEYEVPEGVVSIMENAFASCSNLTSVKIPNSVTEMGFGIFQNAEKLASVTIPFGVRKIEGALFIRCKELTSVTLPAGVNEIKEEAFLECEKLKDVTVRMQTPLNIEGKNVFDKVPLSEATLTVPKGSKAAYESAPVWKDFKEIKEADAQFDVQPASLDLGYSWDEKIIEVTSDRPWKATLEGNVTAEFVTDDSNPKDIKTAPEITGNGSRVIRLYVLPNGSTTRTGKITVETTDADTPAKKEITVKQKGWYGVEICGIGVTPENYTQIDAAHGFTGVKSGSVTYVPSTNTLTLDNAEIESTRWDTGISFHFSSEATIVLKGDNKVKASPAPAIYNESYGKPLHFTGDGSLNASTVGAEARYSIFSYGEITIDGCNIDAEPSIRSNNEKIIINNAEIHVKGTPKTYGNIVAFKGIELKGGVKLLEPKDAEIKLYDAYHDDQGNTYKSYSFLQGNTPCTEVSIGHEIKFEAKLEAEGQVAIDGGEKKVKVESDSKWKMTIPTEAASWIEVGTKTVGTNPNDSTVTLKVKSNLADGEPRSATLVFETITGKSYNAKREVKIEQEGSLIKAEWVAMNDTVLPSKKEVKQVKVKVTSNTLWEVSVPDTSNWLRIVKADNSQVKKIEGKFDGKADSTFSFLSIQDNSEYGSRMQKITFKTKDGKHTATLDMVQNGRFTLDLPTDDLGKVPADGLVEKQIIVKSEDPWKVDVTALTTLRAGSVYGLPWLKLETSPLAGGTTHDSVIKITVVPNAGTVARKAKVVFKNANDDAIMGEFKVSQIGKTSGGGGSGHSGGGSSSSGGSGRVTPPAIVSVTGLTLNKTSVVVDGNAKTVQIVATILPQNATNKSVKWVSSNPDVASVDDAGLVTIHKKGVAVITATAADGSGKTGKCSILVRSTVANAAVPEARIYAAEGLVYMTLPQAATVRIYSLNGVLVRSLTAPAGLTTVALPTGIYIVRTGERTEKVLVN